MKTCKAICNKILFPPLWLILLSALTSAAALTAVFVKGWDDSPCAPVVYALAAYSLTVVCLACWKTFPRYYKKVKGKVCQAPYAGRYLTDTTFKTRVTLCRSLAVDLLYAAVNAASAVIYRTSWFAIFAVYYAVMAVMRFLLVRFVGHNAIGQSRPGELKRARLCAFILMTVDLTLAGAVLMMVHFDRGFEYQGMLIYVMAAYTFYITTTAVIDIVKYRKYNSPVMLTSKVIKLAAALVSMLSLETAMLSQFGGDAPPEMRKTLIMATGSGISAVITALAVYVIVRSTIDIKRLALPT